MVGLPTVASAPSQPAIETTKVRPTPPRARRLHVPVTLARVAQFPSPGSLTEEEQLFLQYLRTTPPQVLVAANRNLVRNGGHVPDLRLRDLALPGLVVEPLPEQSGEQEH